MSSCSTFTVPEVYMLRVATELLPSPTVIRPLVEMTLDDVVPDARALDDGGTGGLGLPIVQALSAECGVTKTEPFGKWVWAKVAV